MGNSPSRQSTSEATGSPLASQGDLGAHPSSSCRSHTVPAPNPELADISPPPYTPMVQTQEVAPPVPPRDPSSRRPRRSSPEGGSVVAVSSRPHRRTASKSPASHSTTHTKTPAAASADTRSPGDGVGGFLAPQQLSPGSNFTRANTTATRSQEPSTPIPDNTTRSRHRSPKTSKVLDAGGGQTESVSTPRNAARRNSKENPLDLLRKFDTVIIVDDSSSMEGALWIEARDALAGIADAAARYGTTGIDLHFLNDRRIGTKLKSASEVKRLFDSVTPVGITPTGEKLEELLLDYLLRLESTDTTKPKPVNFVILTDGAPTDDPESVIVTAAKRLDNIHAPISQIGIQFVQLGSDPEATEALREMDDELANRHGIRDMVDTTLYTGQQLTTELLGKILLGGINRRVDHKGYHT